MPGVLLITGGSRGSGAATGRLAARRGCAVAINYRAEAEAAAALVEQIEDEGCTAIAVQADVARQSKVERSVRRNRPTARPPERPGQCGRHQRGAETKVADFEQAVLERLLAVNVNGTMLCCREAVRRMFTARGGAGGAIVNVSSMAAAGGPGAARAPRPRGQSRVSPSAWRRRLCARASGSMRSDPG